MAVITNSVELYFSRHLGTDNFAGVSCFITEAMRQFSAEFIAISRAELVESAADREFNFNF